MGFYEWFTKNRTDQVNDPWYKDVYEANEEVWNAAQDALRMELLVELLEKKAKATKEARMH